ncbi:hypothetical protein [Hymenobacter segetis]
MQLATQLASLRSKYQRAINTLLALLCFIQVKGTKLEKPFHARGIRVASAHELAQFGHGVVAGQRLRRSLRACAGNLASQNQ